MIFLDTLGAIIKIIKYMIFTQNIISFSDTLRSIIKKIKTHDFHNTLTPLIIFISSDI